MTRVRDLLRRCARYRSIRLTSEGLRFVLLAIGVGVGAINTGNNLLYLLFSMMLSLIVISGILSERCFTHLHISRRMPPALFADELATAAFVVSTRASRVPTFSLRLMDMGEGAAIERDVRLLHLRPGATVILPYPLRVPRRGRYRVEAVKVSTRFPFGLFVKAATIPCLSEITVYPAIRPLPPLALEALQAQGQERSLPRRGHGMALHELRLYQPGDDSRAIHWKITARKSQLIVRETEAEDQRRATIGFPVQTPAKTLTAQAEAQFEEAVSWVASMAAYLIGKAYDVRLVVGEQEVPYGMGQGHLSRMLEVIALCQPVCGTAAPSAALQAMLDAFGDDEVRLIVSPWPGPGFASQSTGSVRCVLASDLSALSNERSERACLSNVVFKSALSS